MNKKILGFLTCVLFIGTNVCPIVAGIDKDIHKNEINDYNTLINRVIKTGVISNNNWSEQDKLFASDGATLDYFGRSVSIDGDYAIIGAWGDDDNGVNSGSAYVFLRSGTTWTEQIKLQPSDAAAGDIFGDSVSIDGDYAIIGAWGDDDNGVDSGSAYVFLRSGTVWTQEAKLLASDGAAYDHFGEIVSIDGNTAVMGVRVDDDNGVNSGSAYIFTRSGTVWTEQAKLLPSDGAAGDFFGCSVSIDGNYTIIGANKDDDNGEWSGSAYIFLRSGAVWTQHAKLLASDGATGDWFGHSVSIDGDNAIIGAIYDDDNGEDSGSAYIFTRSGTVWTEQAKLLTSDGSFWDDFGVSVSIDGDRALIGAVQDDDNGVDSGSAYVFLRSGTVWTQEAKLLASDGADDDAFGGYVSIDGDRALIGAYCDDDNGSCSGSAYIFKKENEPPIVEITNPDEGDTVSGITTTSGTANDSDGIVECVEVKIDNENWENASGTTNWTYEWNTTQYIDGNHTIYARSNDGENYSNVDIVNVTVDNSVNHPPNAPTITGPTNGKVGTEYNYTCSATDPDGDKVKYYFDWGDETFSVTDLVNSGESASANHSWNKTGTFSITVKAIDEYGAASDWSELSVTMPRNRAINTPFLQFLEQYPILYQLLQRFLRL